MNFLLQIARLWRHVMKNLAAAILATLVVAAAVGGGYAWALHIGDAQIQDGVARIRAQLGPNGSFSYSSSAVHPFSRSADLEKVALRMSSGALLTADHVTLVSGGGNKVSSLHMTAVRIAGPADQGAATAASLDCAGIILPIQAPGQPFDPSATTVRDTKLQDIVFMMPGEAATIAAAEIKDYGPGRSSSIVVQNFALPLASARNIDSVSFASATLSGVDAASAINAILHDAQPPQLSTGPSSLEISNFSAANGGNRVVFVREISVSTTPSVNGAKSASEWKMAGVFIQPADAQAQAQLANLGLREIRGGRNWSRNLHALRRRSGCFTSRPS